MTSRYEYIHPRWTGLSKAERILSKIKERTGGELLISRRQVPYLRISPTTTACYFGNHRFIRVFEQDFDMPDGQRRTDFKEWPVAATYIQGERHD